MAIEELLDDDAFDPKKLFNKEEYNTLILNREGFSSKQNAAADLVESLLDEQNTRQQNEELFVRLKEAQAGDMLVKAIEAAQNPRDKSRLVAACWESGIDFSRHFLFFVTLACDKDFAIAMEALTVVENCEGTISAEILNKAKELADSSKSSNTELLSDLKSYINARLS
jgi:hypothetical protein